MEVLGWGASRLLFALRAGVSSAWQEDSRYDYTYSDDFARHVIDRDAACPIVSD